MGSCISRLGNVGAVGEGGFDASNNRQAPRDMVNDTFLLDVAPVAMRKATATGNMPQKAISRHTRKPVIVDSRSMPAEIGRAHV